MRYAIVADIHSNLAAFQAVLAHLKAQEDAHQLWCLGDVVGYGPDPGGCIELLQQYPHLAVAGNHDWGAVGKASLTEFNPDASAACRWTGLQLTPQQKRYLEDLPLRLEMEGFTLVHGSPRDPMWEYLLTTAAVQANLDYFSTPHCLVGHSHVPFVVACPQEGGPCFPGELLPGQPLLLDNYRYVINPGSVGQPRDGDPNASYALYDSEQRSLTCFRVPYDIEAVQERMRAQGLPPRLIERLGYGL